MPAVERTAPVKWADDTEAFRREYEEGKRWEAHVANFFRLCGLQVFENDPGFRSSIDQAHEYINTKDLSVEGKRIEVKALRLRIVSPTEIHGVTRVGGEPVLFVDDAVKFDAKDPKPYAYVNISKATGTMIAVSPKRSDEWIRVEREDSQRGTMPVFYAVPIRPPYVNPMDVLVAALRGRQ